MNSFKKASCADNTCIASYNFSGEGISASFFELMTHNDVSKQYPAMAKEPHCHDMYTVVAFEKGNGLMISGSKEYEIADNTLLFIPPRQVHKFVNLSSDAVGGTLYFTEDYLAKLPHDLCRIVKYKLFSKVESNQYRQLRVEGNLRIKEDFDRIRFRLSSPLEGRLQNDYLGSALSMLLLDVIENCNNFNSNDSAIANRDMKVYMDFLECVERNFKQIHIVDRIVQDMDVSLSTLIRSVKAVSNRTPASILNERIIQEAQLLLCRNPGMRVKEIGFLLGFQDSSNFVKFFTHQVGTSPIKYRNQFD